MTLEEFTDRTPLAAYPVVNGYYVAYHSIQDNIVWLDAVHADRADTCDNILGYISRDAGITYMSYHRFEVRVDSSEFTRGYESPAVQSLWSMKNPKEVEHV